MGYCLKMGGDYMDPMMMGMMRDCAEMCQTCMNMMMCGSEFIASICKLCSEVCMKCAECCSGMIDDEMMMSCSASCRACADACMKMCPA